VLTVIIPFQETIKSIKKISNSWIIFLIQNCNIFTPFAWKGEVKFGLKIESTNKEQRNIIKFMGMLDDKNQIAHGLKVYHVMVIQAHKTPLLLRPFLFSSPL
jgi:hypothetical protein